MFLFLMIAVSAETTYNETGNHDSYFQQGLGFFNTQLSQDDIIIASRALNNPTYQPLVADLDGDGINEIIVLDGLTFRLYNTRDLTILDSYNLEGNNRVSNFITFNIDSDSFVELIIADEIDEILYILEYNGSLFTNQSKFDLSALTAHNDGEILIKCGENEKCILAYSTIYNAGVQPSFYIASFNSSNFTTGVKVRDGQAVLDDIFCFPLIRTASYADYDNDGTDEFIFSSMNSQTSDDSVFIDYVRVLDNLTPVLENTIEITAFESSSSTANCGNLLTEPAGRLLTPPLVFDIDGSSSNGFETAIGYMIGANDYLLRVYNKDGNSINRHPALTNGEGEIVSNVIKMSSFTDTGDVDYCVMGFEQTIDVINLLCGSTQTGQALETQEYEYDVSDLYDLTLDNEGISNTINHAAQHSTITSDGTNLHEIINSYGVFFLDTTFPNTLDLIFQNPKNDSCVIPVDVEDIGREDLLVLQDNRLWYLDDGFTNTGGFISRYIINPCLDATWKFTNETTGVFEARITVSDINSDDVSAKAILYYGSDNEQDSGWTANASSGTTFTIGGAFKINKTISTGVLRLMGRDVENPTDTDIIDLSFSVGLNGVVFGDCETDSGDLIIEEEELEETDIDVQGNALTTGFRTIGGLLGFSESLVYLIIMVVVALGIWWQGSERFPSQTFGVLIIAEVLLLIIGVKLQLIGIGILLTVVLTLIIAVALWSSKFLMGTAESK